MSSAWSSADRLRGAPERDEDGREALGWDGILAIVILLAAALDLHTWLSALPGGAFLFRVLWWLIYVTAAVRLGQIFGRRSLTWTARHQPALCGFLILTLVSTFGSLLPSLSLLRAISLAGTTMTGVYMGLVCSPHQLVRVLRWTFLVVIVSTLLMILLLPADLGVGTRGWYGTMQHKNGLGAVAVLATIFFLVTTARAIPRWILVATCLYTAWHANSRTSFLALAIGLAATACLTAWMPSHPSGATLRRAAFGLGSSVVVIPLVVAPFAAALGDHDPTNGRARIWAASFTIAAERPWTGYGFSTVWGRREATLLPHVPVTMREGAVTAHNGVLTVATEMGVPAAILALAYLLGSLVGAARLFDRAPSPFSRLALVSLACMVVMNIGEAQLFRIHSIFWIVFVALAVTVERALTHDDAVDRRPAPVPGR